LRELDRSHKESEAPPSNKAELLLTPTMHLKVVGVRAGPGFREPTMQKGRIVDPVLFED